MATKVALITGATGQDGRVSGRASAVKGLRRSRRQASFVLAEHAASGSSICRPAHAGCQVFSALRRSYRRDESDPPGAGDRSPIEIYNLGAQSHVQVSFETPEYTANADALGTLRLLEAIRILKLESKVRFYQASTSELYGKVQETPQRETTPFYPRSPVCGGQALRLLDHGQLSRGLRHPRIERHPVQPREPDPRRDLCDAQGDTRGRGDRSWACSKSSTSATSMPSAIGAMRATTSKACGGSCSRSSRTIMCWRPAKRTPSASLSSMPSPGSAAGSHGRAGAG